MEKTKIAVFPVGGLGTRFLPATKCMPKEMLPVVDKPLIQYAYEEARDAGIEQFIFITGRNKNIISNHFDHAYELQRVLGEKEKDNLLELAKEWLPKAGNVAFIRQQEPLGLGHAIYCARHFVGNRPFAVLLADEMLLARESFLKTMAASYDKTGGNVIGLAEVAREDISKYGIVEPEEGKGSGALSIRGMVEKPAPDKAPSNLSIIGRYILQPELFSYLEKSPRGKDGEIQLTDALNAMARDKRQTYGVRFQGRRFDCGSKIGFLQANIAYGLEREDLRDALRETILEYAG